MTLSVRKVVTWLLLVLAVLYLVHSPEQAAGLVRTGAGALVDLGAAMVSFARSLV